MQRYSRYENITITQLIVIIASTLYNRGKISKVLKVKGSNISFDFAVYSVGKQNCHITIKHIRLKCSDYKYQRSGSDQFELIYSRFQRYCSNDFWGELNLKAKQRRMISIVFPDIKHTQQSVKYDFPKHRNGQAKIRKVSLQIVKYSFGYAHNLDNRKTSNVAVAQ